MPRPSQCEKVQREALDSIAQADPSEQNSRRLIGAVEMSASPPLTMPQAWSHAVAGRVTAWEWLERNWMAAGYPPLEGDLQQAAWRVVGAIYDAIENFCTFAQTHDVIEATLRQLARETSEAPSPARAILAAVLRQGAVNSLPQADCYGREPALASRSRLRLIARAARPLTKREQIPNFVQVTENNALLGPLLHGGDEIWAAAGLLIERAQSSVALQVWSYYRRSEAAKLIMAALGRLLVAQAQRREEGTLLRAIEVRILTGCLDEDLGLEHHTGGLSAQQPTTSAGFGTPHYCIFPYPVDPELMHVTVLTQKPDARGQDHTKTLLIDDALAVVSTANIQGNHHRISCDGVPLHDIGYVLGGDVVAYSLLAQMRHNVARAHVLADNAHQKPCSREALVVALMQIRNAHTPCARDAATESIWQAKKTELHRSLELFAEVGPQKSKARIVALAQPAQTLLFASNKRTAYQRGILAALASAQHCIDVNHSNIGAPPVLQALKAALSRGVDISLMASDGLSDTTLRRTQRRRKHIFDILVAHKRRTQASGQVRLRWHRHAYFGHTYRDSHAKALFIDGQLAIVGTVNLDAQAWRQAGELGLIFNAPWVVEQLWRALFMGFWDAARRKLDADELPEPDADLEAVGDDELAFEGGESADLAGAPSGQPKQVTMQSLAKARAPGRFVDILFHQALASRQLSDKAAYLRDFNQYFAPRIATEEAALERLAVKHIRLSLPAATPFALNIRRDAAHRVVLDYAPSYEVVATLVDPEEGLRAYLLQPHALGASEAVRCIIVYEGTTVRKDAIRRLASHPTGRRSAADPRGLGYSAFAASAGRLLAWSQAAQARGMPVTLLGFSLGGVQAARHWHALDTAQRATTRLITFAMPGLDRQTAQEMVGPEAQMSIRHFRVHLDPFSKVGQVRAPGQVVRYAARRPYPSLANHTWAYLSEREIDGLPLRLQFDTGHDADPLSPRLDRVRRFWGLFRPAR